MQRKSQLSGLPEPLRRERDQTGKRILQPGVGLVSDYVNRNSLSLFPFTVGAVNSIRVLPANPMRTYLIIQNKSAGILFVNFGQNANAVSSLNIIAGGNYELIGGANGGSFVPGDDVYVLGNGAGLAGVIAEGLWQSVAI